jgi:SAM-dependent methyltransferase
LTAEPGRDGGERATGFVNAYADAQRAETYARLEFPGTYYLAFRDLPEIIGRHVAGRKGLDFGCGTGRSTRFLRNIGFDAIGVDIAAEMIEKAREFDPKGEYRLVGNGDLGAIDQGSFDVILSAFTFDNIPTAAAKIAILSQLRSMTSPEGVIINLVSSPEMYTHEWESISTRDFPENRVARDGDVVLTIITATGDPRPVEDELCSDGCYREIYGRAGLEIAETCAPLAREDEPYAWVSEITVAPWVIYVLKRAG